MLDKILMNYLDKDADILNFILASKTYYDQFYDTLLLHNVLHGGCTALEWAATTGDKALVEKILEIPVIEKAAPRNIWPRTVNNVRDRIDLVELLLQVDCVRASIDEEARDIARKGIKVWRERKFQDSWLLVMWNAIDSNQADVIELFLSLGLTVESCDEDGSTALYRAAGGSEKVSLVRLLLEKYQADPNKIAVNLSPLEHRFISSLCVAAAFGNAEVVKLLLKHQADPCSGQPGAFCQALAEAVTGVHRDIVNILSRDERVELDAQDADGITILGRAVMSGRPELVQTLLENERLNPNVTTASGKSPLMIAARGVGFGRKGSGLAMTELFLSDKRVNMFLKDNRGWNAQYHAAEYGDYEVLKMYLKDGRLDPNEADENLNMPVSSTKDGKCLKLLIDDARVDLNKANNEGMTPLMHNVSLLLPGNVERLVDSGRVNVNQANHQGNTAMMMAILNHDRLCGSEASIYRRMVRRILHSGKVNLDLVNADGETALMMAVKSEMADAVKRILATGHRMTNAKDAHGITMIEHATRNDTTEIVQLLLETREVQVTRKIIESAKSKAIRDMLVNYKDMMG